MNFKFTKLVFDYLKRKVFKEDNYAWSWHANIASVIDMHTPLGLLESNKVAAAIMLHFFDKDMTLTQQYRSLFDSKEQK